MNTEVFMLGKWQTLSVISLDQIGAYLGFQHTDSAEVARTEKVLLPKKQVPAGIRTGDTIRVFLYRDSRDRIIATTKEPKLSMGEAAVLQVKQVTPIGAFLDWGLEKDLLLPFRQQKGTVEEGMYYPVALYVDKSGRLAATMWVEKYLSSPDPDERRRKLSLLHLQADAENVYRKISRMGGILPYNDRADAEVIQQDFGLSKNAFKKAVGVLYKARRLVILDDRIELR